MKPVHIRVTQDFPHALADAYAWLTDFDEADVDRAQAVITRRKVLEQSKERAVYEGEQSVLGRKSWGRSEVQFHPPDAWEARVATGPRTGSHTTYRLTPVPRGTRIQVDYHLQFPENGARMVLLRVAKPLVRRELAKMWTGYAAAMQRELAPWA